MTYQPSMAEGQAIGLCWLARQPGLPPVHFVRVAVVQLHQTPCAWCDWPLSELVAMLARVDHDEDKAWWRLPSVARLRAIADAAGREATA